MTIVLSIGIVISQKEIITAIPIGTDIRDAVAYLEIIDSNPRYFGDDSEDPLLSPSYPWLESDVGYYRALLENVRPRWWSLPRGRYWRIWVGVSDDGKVTQVIIRGSRETPL